MKVAASLLLGLALSCAGCSEDTTPAADTGPTPDHVAADQTALDTGGAADTGAADMGVADTGAADTGAADTGATDTAGTTDGGAVSCQAQDAKGQGMCDMHLGVKWDGVTCVSVSGCSCVGTDCKTLAPDHGTCYKAHAHCVPCTAMDAKGDGRCKMLLGWVWDGKTCASISGCTCKGTDCNKLFPSLQYCQLATSKCP